MDIGYTILNIILAILLAYGLGILYYGIYRIIIARAHGRWGPPILQNFIDNFKLFSKREAISHGPMFHLGPIIMAAGSVTTILFIPFFRDSQWLNGFAFDGNLILITYLMVVGPLGNALAVGVSGVPFGVMGVTRGLTRMIALETPLYFAIAILMVSHGTISVHDIMNAQSDFYSWNLITHPLAFIVSLFSFVGFMGASPFDVVGAPPEVASGPRAEFNGKYLGILMSQRMIFAVAKLVLWVDLFFGGAGDIFELLWKTFILFIFQIAISIAYPRFKTEQAVDFLMKIPIILGIIAVIYHFWL